MYISVLYAYLLVGGMFTIFLVIGVNGYCHEDILQRRMKPSDCQSRLFCIDMVRCFYLHVTIRRITLVVCLVPSQRGDLCAITYLVCGQLNEPKGKVCSHRWSIGRPALPPGSNHFQEHAGIVGPVEIDIGLACLEHQIDKDIFFHKNYITLTLIPKNSLDCHPDERMDHGIV